MNAENFREYLNDPSLLYQVPYEELKSLALEYPYNTHLRWLLLQKSRMDHRPDVRKALEKAAVYSIDRRALYRFVQRPYDKAESPLFVFTEDYLELKDLSILREELPPATAEPVAAERPMVNEPQAVYRDVPVPAKIEDEEEEHLFDFSEPVEATGEVTPSPPEAQQVEAGTPIVETAVSQPVADEPMAISESPEIAAAHTDDEEPATPKVVPANEPVADEPMAVFYKPAMAPEIVSDRDLEETPPVEEMVAANEPVADEPMAVFYKPAMAPEVIADRGLEEVPSAEEVVAADESVADEPMAVAEPSADVVVLSDADLQEYQATLAAADAVLEKAAQVTSTAPMSKKSFKSWAATTPPPLPEAPKVAPVPEVKPEKKPKKPDFVAEIARQSILENEDLATETLADLLASQQQYEKAAKMYERLILKFPEKSAYFAAKIEKLKKK